MDVGTLKELITLVGPLSAVLIIIIVVIHRGSWVSSREHDAAIAMKDEAIKNIKEAADQRHKDDRAEVEFFRRSWYEAETNQGAMMKAMHEGIIVIKTMMERQADRWRGDDR